jgi:hypothetical protein
MTVLSLESRGGVVRLRAAVNITTTVGPVGRSGMTAWAVK